VIIAANKISHVDSGPAPRIIGIGPIRITAPPLVIPWPFVKEEIIIRIMPTSIIAKLAKKIQERPTGWVLAGFGLSA